MSNLRKLAEAVARTKMHVDNLAVMSTPTDPADAVLSETRYRLAVSAWVEAEIAYRKAIAGVTLEEIERAFGGKSVDTAENSLETAVNKA